MHGWRGAVAIPISAVQTTALTVQRHRTAPIARIRGIAYLARVDAAHLCQPRSRGEELNEDFYRAAKPPKAIWKISQAGHVGGLKARPEEYERRVVGFLRRNPVAAMEVA
jgi:hypothetical protein